MFIRVTKNKVGNKHMYNNTDTSPDLRNTNAPLDQCKYSCEQFVNDYAYVSSIYFYTRESSWNPNSSIIEPDRPQHERPAAPVVAQQYSSATFISQRFHTRQGKVWRSYKNIIDSFFFCTS